MEIIQKILAASSKFELEDFSKTLIFPFRSKITVEFTTKLENDIFHLN
jgi:hypothetical protein